MPKATWGAGDNALTAADIDGAEMPEARQRYTGELPPAGTYRFTLQSLKKGSSAEGNNKVVIFATIDGEWKPNHAKYDGAPVWNHLALTKGNAPNVKAFLESIGATSKDLMNGGIVDENDYFTKLGRVGDPAGLQLYMTVKHSATSEKYPDPRLEVVYGGYLPIEDGDEGDGSTDDAAGDGDDGDEAPF